MGVCVCVRVCAHACFEGPPQVLVLLLAFPLNPRKVRLQKQAPALILEICAHRKAHTFYLQLCRCLHLEESGNVRKMTRLSLVPAAHGNVFTQGTPKNKESKGNFPILLPFNKGLQQVKPCKQIFLCLFPAVPMAHGHIGCATSARASI